MTQTQQEPLAAVPDQDVQDSFRAAMGQVASPVSIITTIHAGHPHGTTVSAFISLSMSPAMLLVSLDNRSQLLSKLRVRSPIGINVLGSHQADLALRFAARGIDTFQGVGWFERNSVALFDDNHAWVTATVESLVPGGDHTVVLCKVVDARAGSGAPLTYYSREFGTHVGNTLTS